MENETVRTNLRGTVVFLKANEGSKSESILPFLYQRRDVPPQRVMLRNDNPFENTGFSAYDGRQVEVVGEIVPSGTFVVDEVHTILVDES